VHVRAGTAFIMTRSSLAIPQWEEFAGEVEGLGICGPQTNGSCERSHNPCPNEFLPLVQLDVALARPGKMPRVSGLPQLPALCSRLSVW
jgi:hypothetical protein